MTEPVIDDGDGYKVNVDIFGKCKEFLPGYQPLFSAGSRGFVNDSTWLPLPFEYGIGMFVHPSISILQQTFDFIHSEFRSGLPSKPPLGRTAQVIRCSHKQGHFTLVNLHGLWQPNGKKDSEERREQANKLSSLIKRVAQKDEPLIVCGDFNVLPDSETFSILRKVGLEDINKQFDIHCTRSSLYKKEVRYADYFLANKSTEIHSLTVMRDEVVSDHCPLNFEFNLLEPLEK